MMHYEDNGPELLVTWKTLPFLQSPGCSNPDWIDHTVLDQLDRSTGKRRHQYRSCQVRDRLKAYCALRRQSSSHLIDG